MKRVIAGLLLPAAMGWAGITFDNAASSGSIAASTLTASVSNFAVASRASLLVVVVSAYETPSKQVSSITWQGSTAGWTKAIRESDGAHNAAAEIWYLPGPATGTGNVAVTLAGDDGSSVWGFEVYSFIGTASSNPIYGATGSVKLTGVTSISDSTTVANSGDWLVDVVAIGLNTSGTAGGSQSNAVSICAASGNSGSTSLAQNPPAGPVTMSWAFGGSSGLASAHAMAAIKAATGKPGGFPITM